MTHPHKNVISIFGNSGVGKSTLANALVAALGHDISCRVRADHYLKSRFDMPLREYLIASDLFDWELLEDDLSQAIGTEISTPVFDYTEFQRLSRRGNKPFRVSQYNVVDALTPYPKSTLSCLIDIGDQERRARFIQRGTDYPWGEFVLAHWHACTKDFTHLQPDMTLNGAASLAENVQRVVGLLIERQLL